MRFGPVPVAEAVGATLAHAVRTDRRLKKGRVLTEDDVAALRAVGVTEVIVARLDADDAGEDEAAGRLALALAGDAVVTETAATGRCNLHATADGLFTADRAAVDALNAVDPAITLATLPDATPVSAGRMVATVKIIPFAVPRAALDRAISQATGAFELHPFRPMRVAMISTLLDTLKPSVVEKTERVTRERLDALSAELVVHERVPHEKRAAANALSALADVDLAIVFGASAVADEDDVIPAAIRAAGGDVDAVGMPVDPGNLLCVGRIGAMHVLGAPGCSRSPAENGFDWALARLAAGLPVDRAWLRGLGVGGLLMEIGSRPSPRETTPLAVIVLAAGRSSRMGAQNKLLKEVDGTPLVVRAVDAALAAGVGPVTVVTGHEADGIEAALRERDVRFAHNPDYADGMSTSLRAGLDAIDAGAAMVLLADMPDVAADGIRCLAEAFRREGGSRVVAACDPATERRGNPVVWPAALFDELRAIEGDRGARDVLRTRADEVVTVDMEGAGLDLDTPEAFAERLKG